MDSHDGYVEQATTQSGCSVEDVDADTLTVVMRARLGFDGVAVVVGAIGGEAGECPLIVVGHRCLPSLGLTIPTHRLRPVACWSWISKCSVARIPRGSLRHHRRQRDS